MTTLTSLDDVLSELRTQLQKWSNPPAQTDKEKAFKKPDYSTLDIPKAKRLIAARENSIKSCKSLLTKHQAPRIS